MTTESLALAFLLLSGHVPGRRRAPAWHPLAQVGNASTGRTGLLTHTLNFDSIKGTLYPEW